MCFIRVGLCFLLGYKDKFPFFKDMCVSEVY